MAKKNIEYNRAMEELNKILSDLESENIDVDELSNRVKRAIELIRLCKNKIRKTEMEVKNMMGEFEEELSGDNRG